MKPLIAVTRNGVIESIHHGLFCVVDADCNILFHSGDERTKIFFRSSAKPIQVIPTIRSGATREYGFTLKEIAIACASHNGDRVHQDTVENMLKKMGLNEKHLHCGTMDPYSEKERSELIRLKKQPSVLHSSCSGKHAAMLALAKFKGYDMDDYESLDHPVQKEIMQTISAFTDEQEISSGIDGCGVPVYLLPIYKIALSYARLMRFSQQQDNPYHSACETVIEAMTKHPEMVAGDGEFCTELMRVTKDKLIAKIGAEAVYSLGIKKGCLGICIKIADGNERAVYPVVMRILQELEIIDEAETSHLKKWSNTVLENNKNEVIGQITPIFSLVNPQMQSSNLGDRLSSDWSFQ